MSNNCDAIDIINYHVVNRQKDLCFTQVVEYLSDDSCLYNMKADLRKKAGAFLLHSGHVQKQASS